MTTQGMKDIDKTALTLSLWMTAIVGIVAWRSHGDPMAICFTAGLPLGVFSFWLVFTLGKKVDANEDDKKKKLQKALATAPQASPVQARMPYTPPLAAAPVQVAKMQVDAVVSAALEPEIPMAPFSLDNLNELDYLYKPSSGRERGTLFTATEDSNPSLRPSQPSPFPAPRPATMDLGMDWND